VRPEVPVADLLDRVERHLIGWFNVLPTRASVSFVGVEPIEVLRFDQPDQTLSLVTLGMCRRAMTPPDAGAVSADGPRAELRLDGRAADRAWRQLAVLAAAPAVEGIVYAAGCSVDLGTPLGVGSRCTGGLIDVSDVPSLPLDSGSVEVLRVLPATASELAWSRVHGAAALRQLWMRQSTDVLDLMRSPARLD
jgi:Suppressor of fused protein (SUFU)